MHADVPHAPGSVSLVRRSVVEELHRCAVPEPVVQDAALVVSELVGNAVRHGQPLPGGGLEVDCRVDRGRVQVTVVEGGTGPLRGPVPVDRDAEGGRGLLIVEALAGAWGVRPAPGGCAVWVELPLGLARA